MTFGQALVGSRIIETTENYSIADLPLQTRPIIEHKPKSMRFEDDQDFWNSLFLNPEKYWGCKINFYGTILSEWVPRVPGLYWKSQSKIFRNIKPEDIELRGHNWETYTPFGKSKVVLGGVGTMRFPPSRDGFRLATLTTKTNVSAGVPALISEDVWERYDLQEGSALRGSCTWQAMESGWSSKFPSTKGIPRGYLLIDEYQTIEPMGKRFQTLIHPFTIMEYRRGSNELFDFVFASANTQYSHYRDRIRDFYETYKNRNERYGRYLLACDMINPLWEAEYNNPNDLRRADPSATSQLRLIEARVEEQFLNENVIDETLRMLPLICKSVKDIERLSDDIMIPVGLWFSGGTLAESVSQFVDEVVHQNKMTSLVDAIAGQYEMNKLERFL